MKVSKIIIVDKLPEYCGACLFDKELTPHRAKSTYRRVCLPIWKDNMPAIREHRRLKECPLQKYCEICKGTGFVVHATKGIVPCPECSK